jgi:hypothetical protein
MVKKLSDGKSHPDIYQPHMPEVDAREKIEDIFVDARRAARGETRPPGAEVDDRFYVVVTPGRMVMYRPCPPAGSISPEQVAPIERLLPPAVKRNIAVIANTELQAVMKEISRAIPFVGMLMGFAYIGHAVWIFEGQATALQAGCREADLLIVDGGMVPFLSKDWIHVAQGVMRNREIYVHDRATFKLTRVNIG